MEPRRVLHTAHTLLDHSAEGSGVMKKKRYRFVGGLDAKTQDLSASLCPRKVEVPAYIGGSTHLEELQGYLAHKKLPLPLDRHRALGTGLL